MCLFIVNFPKKRVKSNGHIVFEDYISSGVLYSLKSKPRTISDLQNYRARLSKVNISSVVTAKAVQFL